MDESSLFSKCLEFTRSLLDTKRGFSFQMNTSSGFNFNFTNQDSGKPEIPLKKRKNSPSQRNRNNERMKAFLEKKSKEASGIQEASLKTNEAEYELKVEAHEKCSTEDIVEAVEANFFGALDRAKVDAKDPIRIFKFKKSEEKHVIRKIKGEFRNLQVFKIIIKETETARNVIESWKDEYKFDDYAFKNSDCSTITIKVREVERLR